MTFPWRACPRFGRPPAAPGVCARPGQRVLGVIEGLLPRVHYGRVSTHEQNPEAPHDALTAAGCEQVFVDTASGKLARRAELEKALLSANRAGDQLVVTKLDRLGRSLENLMELSKALQERRVDLVVLDQGIDTSTAIGRMSFQILGFNRGVRAFFDVRTNA